MTKFITNLNKYLSEKKIKQSYLSMIAGIDKNKMSRLLTGAQEESGSDMEKITKALGKELDYFLSESFDAGKGEYVMDNNIAFYAGEPSESQTLIAKNLYELMETIDEVMSAKERFEAISED